MTDALLIEEELGAEKHRTPMVFLAYQQRWFADLSEIKVAEKSRQTGYTWTTAAECALLAASTDGMDCWYIQTAQQKTKEFINDCATWARHFSKVAVEVEETIFKDGDDDIAAFVIRFASGHKITALSSRPSASRGLRGYIVIDEAAFQEKLDEMLEAVAAFTMWGGRVAIISTHNGDDHPFNEFITAVRKGEREASLHRCTIEEALADGLYGRICLRLGREWSPKAEKDWLASLIKKAGGGDGAQQEYYCVPKRSGGAYLPSALIESRMFDAPVLELEFNDDFVHLPQEARESFTRDWLIENVAPLLEKLDPQQMHSFGWDFARSRAVSALAVMSIDEHLVRRTPFILEIRNAPFQQQEQILYFVVDRLPRLIGGALDARGNGQFLAEVAMQRYGGERIAQVMLSERWYLDNMPRFKAAFEDGTLWIARNANVLLDHRYIKVIRGVPKIPEENTTTSDGKLRHGDTAIATCLGHFASRMDTPPIEFLSAGTRVAAYGGMPTALQVTDTGFGTVSGGTDFGGFNG